MLSNGNTKDFLIFILLLIVAFSLAYVLSGMQTSCPKCGEWYVRQTYEKEYQYQTQTECHDQLAHHMYDADGNIISTWYTYDDYTRIDTYFKYFHSCLKCNAKWSTIGTESHRRRW